MYAINITCKCNSICQKLFTNLSNVYGMVCFTLLINVSCNKWMHLYPYIQYFMHIAARKRQERTKFSFGGNKCLGVFFFYKLLPFIVTITYFCCCCFTNRRWKTWRRGCNFYIRSWRCVNKALIIVQFTYSSVHRIISILLDTWSPNFLFVCFYILYRRQIPASGRACLPNILCGKQLKRPSIYVPLLHQLGIDFGSLDHVI